MKLRTAKCPAGPENECILRSAHLAGTLLIGFVLIATSMSPALGAVGPNWIEQWGITWTFDKDLSTDGSGDTYQYGTFVNGDYWIVGPVTITNISPGKMTIVQDGETFTINGNMINPEPIEVNGGNHGYDERALGYEGALNLGIPITLGAGKSLISSISWQLGDDGCPNRYTSDQNNPLYHLPRPCIRTQAVLTCVASQPAAGSFRPPYAGTEKPMFNVSQLQEVLLPNLVGNNDMPSVATVKEEVRRPWINHMTAEYADYIHPSENMPNYGRDIANRYNEASLMSMVDISSEDKHDLTVYLTQIGIDLYYIVKAGGGWGKAGGAIGVGQKWPILFAGILLNNAEMKAVGINYDDIYFQEDSQTFYITQEDIDRFAPTTRTNCKIDAANPFVIVDMDGGSWWDNDEGGQQPIISGRGFPADFWVRIHRGVGTYEVVRANNIYDGDNSKLKLKENKEVSPGTGITVEIQLFPQYRLGYPEWGERHATQPQYDYYSRGYRLITGPTYHGAALSALILNAKDLWDNDAFFDYTDFYMAEQAPGTLQRSWSNFTENMWDTYRADYGPIWPQTSGNQPPNSNAGQDQTVIDIDDNGTEQVVLDGSVSTDDNEIVSYVWSDNLGDTILNGSNPTATLSVGEHTITLTVTDDDDSIGTDTVTVTVSPADTTAPSIESVTPTENSIEILFNEILDKWSAIQSNNYNINSVSGGISVLSASLDLGCTRVTLSTTSHTTGSKYTLTVTGVEDLAGNPMPATTINYQFSDGLVGFWELNENQGATADDSSNSNNDGILIGGATWSTGRIDSAVKLNNPSDAIEVPTGNFNAGSGTITLWAYAENFSNTKHFLFGHATQPWSNRIQLYCDASGNLNLGLGNNPSLRTNIQLLNIGEWYHIALTWDGSNYTVFVNGTPIVGGGYTSLNAFETYADIGNNGNRSARSEAFNGTIDEVCVYNRTLNADEIQELYNAGTSANNPPTAGNDTATVNEDSANNAIDVLANDTDADGDTLIITSVTQANHGSVAITGGGTGLAYTPNPDYNGPDSFTYTISDGQGGIDTATVSVTVTNVPDAPVLETIGDKTINENQTLTIVINATDTDGDTVEYSVQQLPSGATFASPFVWTPDYDDAGTYEVIFVASDGALSDSETITITVNNVNRNPVAADDSAVTDEDTAVTTGNVLINDIDGDGDTLTVISFTQAGHGTVAYNGDGTFTYTPTADYNGSDSFIYTVSDGGDTTTATVQIDVTAINDPPDISAIPDTLQKYEDESILPAEIELATDADSGDTLTYTYVPNIQATDYILHVDVSDGTVTVGKDITIVVIPVPPTVISVTATKYTVEISFSEELEQSSAQNIGNYTLSNGILINAGALNAEHDKVTLYTTGHAEDTIYTLTITGVEDLAGNTMIEDTIDYPYDSGLIGLWRFNDQAGNTAQDSSGYDNTAILVNGPVWSEQGDLNFDGIDDAVEIPTNYWNVNSGTVALWAYAEDLAGTHYLFGHTTGSGSDRIQLYTLDQNLNLGLGNSDELNIENLDLQTWYHFALTWDGTDYVVYVDGTEKASGFYTGLNDLSEFADIGNSGDVSLATAFAGHIDDARVYDKALSLDEIINVYLMSDESIRESKALAFEVSATYPDGTALIYSDSDPNLLLDDTFDGASFENGTFAWNPWYDQAGTYDITFLPADQEQPQYSQTMTIVVEDVQLSGWYQSWLEHLGLL